MVFLLILIAMERIIREWEEKREYALTPKNSDSVFMPISEEEKARFLTAFEMTTTRITITNRCF